MTFKGSLTRDFRRQAFFMNKFPSGPWVSHWGHFEFLQQFAKIFESKGWPSVWKKFWYRKCFLILLRCRFCWYGRDKLSPVSWNRWNSGKWLNHWCQSIKTPVTMSSAIIDRRQHKVENISATFRKNSKLPKWGTKGPGGKLIHEKNWRRKSRVRLPLK